MVVENMIPLACNMNAIPAAERETHVATAVELFKQVERIEERAEGYAFQFSNEAELLGTMAEFVARERLCCPFFAFTIKVEPGNAPLWLVLTGPGDIKPFIRAEFGELVDFGVLEKNNV